MSAFNYIVIFDTETKNKTKQKLKQKQKPNKKIKPGARKIHTVTFQPSTSYVAKG